jgi:hypothetical protein
MPRNRRLFKVSTGQQPTEPGGYENFGGVDQSAGAPDPFVPIIIAAEIAAVVRGEGQDRVPVAIVLNFNLDMNAPSVVLVQNYNLTELENDGTSTVPVPVPIVASYIAATRSVVLAWRGDHLFILGGHLTIDGSQPSGLSSLGGVPLGGAGGEPGTDANLTLSPGASGIVID